MSMAITIAKGVPVATAGDPPAVGSALPPASLTLPDLSDATLEGFAGRKLVLNVFPSIDTRVCALSVRRFNELAAGLPDTTVLCVSHDLPFALGRFCGAEGIENVTAASGFRSDFGDAFGVTMTEGPLRGLYARSVVVLDENGSVTYTELVPEIGQEPDYDAALAALK